MNISSLGGVSPAISATPAITTKHGTVNDSVNGQGTFTDILTQNGDSKTLDRTITYANGKTAHTVKALTHNADGTYSEDITQTLASGKTVSGHETITPSGDDPDTGSVTGTLTAANGQVLNVSGDISESDTGYDYNFTLTDGQGRTSAIHNTASRSGDTTTCDFTRTTFGGVQLSSSIVFTLLDNQSVT